MALLHAGYIRRWVSPLSTALSHHEATKKEDTKTTKKITAQALRHEDTKTTKKTSRG
jgi:hypothetical protein